MELLMEFPLNITANIRSYEGDISRNLNLQSPLNFIIGPNGSGKTHLLKGLKNSFPENEFKKTRYISAGRLGMMEQYRANYDQYDRRHEIDNAKHGNKDFSLHRHNIETIEGDLHTLSERPDILIKVKERLQKLFKRNITIQWDSGYLKIFFSRLGQESKNYSSAREASGLLHLIGILAALYDDEVGVLLIDEPEVSLHPQLQAFLLKEMSRVAGIPNSDNYQKIIIMATHSTEMIKISKADDLLSYIFCNDLKEEPIQIQSEAGELKNHKVKSLIARLGQEHKLALFSRTPLLVEGPSDVIICNAISDKLYLNLEAAGSQILPINGKEAMPETVKLIRLMGKTPTVLVDADAFADGLSLVNAYFGNDNIRMKADSLVSNLGASSITKLAKEIYNDFCKMIDDDWDSISNIAQLHPYFTLLLDNELLNKKRAALCSLFTNENLPTNWISLRNRLISLFDIFEKCGLFILKKGAIESYYHDNNAITDKIDDSIVESDYIYSLNDENILKDYNDILNCLKFASNSEVIDESKAIRDELLTFISPIHARFADGDNLENNINSSPIFNYHVSTNKLTISMNSKVLDVKGFPFVLEKDDDVRKIVNKNLQI